LRREIACAARAAGVPLVVDDVLAELGFGGPEPLVPGAISVGSLSKVVWGGLRICADLLGRLPAVVRASSAKFVRARAVNSQLRSRHM
jgi:DNA-binding transcriptional MocR family regulator